MMSGHGSRDSSYNPLKHSTRSPTKDHPLSSAGMHHTHTTPSSTMHADFSASTHPSSAISKTQMRPVPVEVGHGKPEKVGGERESMLSEAYDASIIERVTAMTESRFSGHPIYTSGHHVSERSGYDGGYNGFSDSGGLSVADVLETHTHNLSGHAEHDDRSRMMMAHDPAPETRALRHSEEGAWDPNGLHIPENTGFDGGFNRSSDPRALSDVRDPHPLHAPRALTHPEDVASTPVHIHLPPVSESMLTFESARHGVSRMQQVLAEMGTASTRTEEWLTAEISRSLEERAKVNTDISRLNEELREAHQVLLRIQESLAAAQAERERIDARTIDNLQKLYEQNGEIQRAQGYVSQQVNNLPTFVQTTESKLLDTDHKRQEAERTAQAQAATISQQRTQLTELNDNLTETKTSLAVANKALNTKTEQLAASQQEVSSRDVRITTLTHQVGELRNTLSLADQAVGTFEKFNEYVLKLEEFHKGSEEGALTQLIDYDPYIELLEPFCVDTEALGSARVNPARWATACALFLAQCVFSVQGAILQHKLHAVASFCGEADVKKLSATFNNFAVLRKAWCHLFRAHFDTYLDWDAVANQAVEGWLELLDTTRLFSTEIIEEIRRRVHHSQAKALKLIANRVARLTAWCEAAEDKYKIQVPLCKTDDGFSYYPVHAQASKAPERTVNYTTRFTPERDGFYPVGLALIKLPDNAASTQQLDHVTLDDCIIDHSPDTDVKQYYPVIAGPAPSKLLSQAFPPIPSSSTAIKTTTISPTYTNAAVKAELTGAAASLIPAVQTHKPVTPQAANDAVVPAEEASGSNVPDVGPENTEVHGYTDKTSFNKPPEPLQQQQHQHTTSSTATRQTHLVPHPPSTVRSTSTDSAVSHSSSAHGKVANTDFTAHGKSTDTITPTAHGKSVDATAFTAHGKSTDTFAPTAHGKSIDASSPTAYTKAVSTNFTAHGKPVDIPVTTRADTHVNAIYGTSAGTLPVVHTRLADTGAGAHSKPTETVPQTYKPADNASAAYASYIPAHGSSPHVPSPSAPQATSYAPAPVPAPVPAPAPVSASPAGVHGHMPAEEMRYILQANCIQTFPAPRYTVDKGTYLYGPEATTGIMVYATPAMATYGFWVDGDATGTLNLYAGPHYPAFKFY